MAAVFVAILATGTEVRAGAPTADDFIPPVQGGPVDVKTPSAVKIEERTVVASTAQDAINTAVAMNKKEMAGGNPGIGVELVKFPSGIGVVASGAATYRVMENSTATRVAKRQAYVVAYTMAKKNLAEHFGGLTHEGQNEIRQAMAGIDTEKDSLTNTSINTNEQMEQTVQKVLRGFVVYEVQDDTAANTIYASIVSTPRTRGRLARPTPNGLDVDDVREGLTQVIAEVRSGLVPPVGGRIITMPKTGETAFVGFGSAVVRTNSNAAVQAKQNLESQKIARMRAQDALCGLIIGDATSWRGGFRETMRDEVKEFENAAQGDPLAPTTDGSKKLEAQRQAFVSKYSSTDTYRSARSGVLPPGIAIKTWFNEDNSWAFAMAVYVPSAASAAAQAADEMDRATLLQPLQPGGDGATGGATGAEKSRNGFKDENNPTIPRPGKDVTPGPTSKTKKDDL